MFQVGDSVVHPYRGAGLVVDIEKLQCLGSDRWYYAITLLDRSGTQVWVSVQDAEREGVRHTITRAQLDQVWSVLSGEPEELPTDHHKRNQVLQAKLSSDVFGVVAAAVRDMFWKDRRLGNLTIEGKRLYERGILLLASEIAVVLGCGFVEAETKIVSLLTHSLAPGPVAA